jgi:hypothetical protein
LCEDESGAHSPWSPIERQYFIAGSEACVTRAAPQQTYGSISGWCPPIACFSIRNASHFVRDLFAASSRDTKLN